MSQESTFPNGKPHVSFSEIKQLKEWGYKYHHLSVGEKPHFDLYICDKSINSEEYFGK